jgi:hypothetical protein
MLRSAAYFLPSQMCRREAARRLQYSARRSHLEKAGLAVAAICNEEELVAAGGLLGRSLFVKSRNTGSGAGNSPQPKLHSTPQTSAEPSDDEQDEALQAE